MNIGRTVGCVLLSLVTILMLFSTVCFSMSLTIKDRKTDLEWQLREPGKMRWPQAMSYCQTLDLSGRNDWRLPDLKELESAYRIKGKFPGLVEDLYWSSTPTKKKAGLARSVSFFKGNAYDNNKRMLYLVRCVRTNTWFTVKKNAQTLKDNETRLMWLKWEPGEMKWQEAQDYCQQLSIDGKRDWRLPDKTELQSAYKIKHRFPNMAFSYYWSSSSNIANANLAWCVYFGKPYIGYYDKSGNTFVRCVRGGKNP